LGYFKIKIATRTNTVGLKDAWEEKGKKESNLLMNTKKKNKYVEKEAFDLE
jgi:glutaminyl-tRNA synthetase